MREVVKDYLWIFEFADIDNSKLYDTCCNVEEQLKLKFPAVVGDNAYGCFTSYYHERYNLLQYNCPELHKLYSNMVNCFRKVMDNRQYYVRCWVNLFDKNKNIDWHSHWNPEQETYHGFYCVNTEGEHKSYTDYIIPGHVDTYRIMSRDGLCVYGKSDGDKHRSSEWLNDNKYRVTIAFDVIPVETLKGELDNFIPLARLPQ
jgi:hypothetical protein